MNIENPIASIVQQEKFKIAKNSRGCNWEIELFIKDGNDEEVQERMRRFHQHALEEYGNKPAAVNDGDIPE